MNYLKTIVITLATLFVSTTVLGKPFTADDLVRLDRVGNPVLSPDGSKVVYSVRTTDMDANKGVYDLWWSGFSDAETHRLTTHAANDTSPAWSADGKGVYFLSTRSGSSQVWRIALDGGEARQVTDLPVDVATFRLAPDGDQLVFSASVYLDCENLACTADRDKAKQDSPDSGVMYEHLFIRHWDHWLDDKYSQLFALALDESGVSAGEPLRLSKGIRADIPSRVWGGVEEYAVSQDGAKVYFVARIRDRDEPTSTNYDIYSAPMNGDGAVVNLTSANKAWDTWPVLSPDGKSLAYLAMSRPGFEADRFQVMIRDLESGKTRTLAGDWDRSVSAMAFSPAGKSLLVTAQNQGNLALWELDINSGQRRNLVAQGNVSAFEAGPLGIVFAMDNLKSPTELYAIDNGAKRPAN